MADEPVRFTRAYPSSLRDRRIRMIEQMLCESGLGNEGWDICKAAAHLYANGWHVKKNAILPKET